MARPVYIPGSGDGDRPGLAPKTPDLGLGPNLITG